MPPPTAPCWLPGLLAAVGVSCTLAAVAMGAWTDAGVPVEASDAVLGLLYPLVGALVLRRRPGNLVGWLLMTSALTGPYLLAGEYAVRAVLVDGDTGFLPDLATWTAAWGFATYYVVVALVPLYFPTGRLPSPRWRPVARLLVTVVVAGTVAAMIRPTELDVDPRLTNPWHLTDALWPNYVLIVCSMAVFLVGGPVGVAALVVRMRHSTGVERTQLQWLVLGASVLVVGTLASLVVDLPVLTSAFFALGFAAVPLAVAVAVLRHGLFDVGQVVSRAVVFTLLSVLLLLAYGGLVAVVGEFSAGERRFAVAAAAVAALAAAAGWERAQRAVDRLLYGERRDPLAVATRVGSTLDVAGGPADALQALVDEVARVLRLPRVAVVPADPRLAPTTSAGPAPDAADTDVLPLTSLGEPVGELHVTHRSPGERWRRPEKGALDDVARRAATLVWAAGLVADLQASRERIVAGREEERRRLRHDLHDGVGPELAGMALQLERLAGKLSGEPDLAALAGRLRDQMRRTVAAVRRAVDDLRPPALDELGLAGALREHVAAYRLPVPAAAAAGDAPAPVTVVAGELPPLRAAVEVAAYRIAAEAVTNAVRHSGAATCRVTLAVADGDLLVEVADDGTGVAPDAVPGVGSTSMRERAAEVGGTLEIDPTPGGGTTVRTRLPLAAR
ncbi:sensor histidine kinase [Geodermatophilus sp. CPCC 206100]|uniref:sensor histidine kinase n=1 Tax=Geodermatophilus sp. CPCC 206100 TaxID=3020054 RepID=UPI003B00542C